MRREELTELGLAPEAVEAVMALYGKGVEKHKTAAQQWQQRCDEETGALRENLAQVQRAQAVRGALEPLQFSSESAKRAFATALEQAALPLDEAGQSLTGFETFAAQYRADDPAAFAPQEAQALPVLVKPAESQGALRLSEAALRRAFGL